MESPQIILYAFRTQASGLGTQPFWLSNLGDERCVHTSGDNSPPETNPPPSNLIPFKYVHEVPRVDNTVLRKIPRDDGIKHSQRNAVPSGRCYIERLLDLICSSKNTQCGVCGERDTWRSKVTQSRVMSSAPHPRMAPQLSLMTDDNLTMLLPDAQVTLGLVFAVPSVLLACNTRLH
ncbi:hypothetical protein BDY19DRAFT_907224 [Irpex rosettiformis]|uniref:Uncharacterized protein n=1 Tax=Irpex rosettiformis TaxID=378272 RepID=A0ACB8U0A7_9APHY|nr:hypothetical protein BDY19DRAFT_907224 [Irpex rosettiformis]